MHTLDLQKNFHGRPFTTKARQKSVKIIYRMWSSMKIPLNHQHKNFDHYIIGTYNCELYIFIFQTLRTFGLCLRQSKTQYYSSTSRSTTWCNGSKPYHQPQDDFSIKILLQCSRPRGHVATWQVEINKINCGLKRNTAIARCESVHVNKTNVNFYIKSYD